MTPYVWCAIGAVLGWLASRMVLPRTFAAMVESVAVGIFGAFVGGEFLPAMLLVKEPGGVSVNPVTVSMAVGGAVACLMLLGVMRRAVGPLKPHKKRRAD